MNYIEKIVKEVSKEEKIKCMTLSDGWVLKLEKDNLIKYIYGYKFDLNSQGTGNILDDKYAFYTILKSKNIPVVINKIIYNFNNNNDYAKGENTLEYAIKFFEDNGKHIVIKPINGSCGNDVCELRTSEELKQTLNNLFKKHKTLCLNPYYEIINEYRVIMINHKSELVYVKRRPIVYGDGIKSIKQLLIEFNPKYFSRIKNLDERVLKKGEKYMYTWKYNLSQGSICDMNVPEEKKKDVIKLARKVSKYMNIKFGSIDIIETDNNELLVLEANSGVMMDNFIDLVPNGYKISKKIYKKAIKEMFK